MYHRNLWSLRYPQPLSSCDSSLGLTQVSLDHEGSTLGGTYTNDNYFLGKIWSEVTQWQVEHFSNPTYPYHYSCSWVFSLLSWNICSCYTVS